MDEAEPGFEEELISAGGVRSGMVLVGVSVVWGLAVAALPPGLRTAEIIGVFMLPLLVAWELGVITIYALLQYRQRVFGRLVTASTNLAVGVVVAIVDFTLIGAFFLLGDRFTGAVPGGAQALFVAIIALGVVGYLFVYRSVRALLATTS